METVYSSIKERNYVKIYTSELLQLLKEHTNPKEDQKNPVIYLFILWRTNFESQVISLKIKR